LLHLKDGFFASLHISLMCTLQDGFVDILVGYYWDHALSYHQNNPALGTARFSGSAIMLADFPVGHGVDRAIVVDMDGDGLTDVAYNLYPDPFIEWLRCVAFCSVAGHCVLFRTVDRVMCTSPETLATESSATACWCRPVSLTRLASVQVW
jgi:hypothetical protein